MNVMRFARRAWVLTPLLVATIGACSAAPGDSSGGSSAPIQGGTPDSGDPAVGLVWFAGGGFCTGTLIAPDVVLTAGHCVQNTIDGFYTGSGTPTANVGATPPPGMTKHAVDKMLAHPTYSANGGCPNTTFDLGLVHLSAPIADIAPLAYASSAAPANGTTCTAIGYGQHEESGQQTVEAKRTGTEIVQSIASTAIQVGIGTGLADHGDSGGPLICNGVIAGATSCHNDGNWPQHQVEFYARVDAGSSWIDSTLTAWGSTNPADGGVDADAGVDAPNGCAHDICAQGGALTSGCDPCATKVCATDSFCCASSWDSQCVGEVKSICQQTCGAPPPPPVDAGPPPTDAGTDSGAGSCAHAICATGKKLVKSCDPCAAQICGADPFCCNTKWDSVCVGEVSSICQQACN